MIRCPLIFILPAAGKRRRSFLFHRIWNTVARIQALTRGLVRLSPIRDASMAVRAAHVGYDRTLTRLPSDALRLDDSRKCAASWYRLDLHFRDGNSHSGLIELADWTKSLIVTLANAFSVAA